MNILAFDLGASSGKLFLAAFKDGNVTVKNIHTFENTPHTAGDAIYWDILYIYEEMNKGIKKAVSMTEDQIDSFAIDSFCNDFALIDEKGGMLTPVRCYRDLRTSRNAASIYRKLPPERLYHLSGNQNALFNAFMQLAAMREEGQGYLLDHAYKLLFIPDLLIYFLTGKTISEYTISSVSQMYDFRKNNWCREILDAYDIPEKIFGTLTKPGTLVGFTQNSYNQLTGTKGFPVSAVCEHDTASAYLSSPLETDCALISCGTWALVGTETDSFLITSEGCQTNLANEGGYSGHHRLLYNVMSSWLIQETKRYYKEHGQNYTYEELGRLAQTHAPFQFLFDPDDRLFYTPGNMPEKICQYCAAHQGSSPGSPGEIIRSIYESLAMKFRWTIERLERITGKKLPAVNMMGGGSRAAMLCQFTANACGRKVIAGPQDASAAGNIAAQLVAIGAAGNIGTAKKMLSAAFSLREYDPEDTDIWETHYQEYIKLLKSPKP